MVVDVTQMSDRNHVVVHAHGRVTTADHVYARDKIARLGRAIPGRVLGARVDLVAHADPARDRPALAKAELDVDGTIVRAHAEAATMQAAIDALQARMRRRLQRLRGRERSVHFRHRDGDASWQHGEAVHAGTPYFPRPVDDRRIVRRKTFALGASTPDEAALDLEALDHDFFLFRNAETDRDCVIHRLGDDGYELLEPRPSPVSIADVQELLDLGDVPFVFFLDAETGRGAVMYRRFDGHYGLVLAASPHERPDEEG